MKYQFAVAAFAGSAFASLEAYGAAPPAYGGEESSTTAAPTAPGYGAETTSAPASSAATYACNPAHQYPGGAKCVSTEGTLSLVTPSTTAPASPETTSAGPSAPGYGGDKTVTDVVSSYVTYCPEPTQFTHEGKTYTVTAATTLTVCPKCEESSSASESKTKTKPASPETTAETTAPTAPVYGQPSASSTKPVENSPETGSSSKPAPTAPVYGAPSSSFATHPAPYPTGNATVPVVGPTGTGASASGTAPPAYTGAATQLVGGAAAGVAGLFAAFFL